MSAPFPALRPSLRPVDAGLDLLEAFATSPATERFYWERPAAGEGIVGFGRALALEAAGPHRFAGLRARVAQLRAGASAQGVDPQVLPLVGGLAFDPAGPRTARWTGFPSLRFVLPAAWIRRDPATRAFVLPAAEGDDGCAGSTRRAGARAPEETPGFLTRPDRPPEAWCATAAAAVRAIHAGRLEKVVLARACTVRAAHPHDAWRVLRSLRAAHPTCTLFAVARGDACFLGASPERLARVESDGRVHGAAVAGSAPRGRTPGEDRARARALRESKKEQEEHAVVAREVRAALVDLCERVEGPESPRILATAGIQHLVTPLHGRLRDPAIGVLGVAARLHPTPAVGGAPRPAALDWLARNEGLDRGWYAGAVGWSDLAGRGELTVALRSALLRGGHATAFAGAGIVRGSDPEAELAETRLKLQGALAALVEI